MRWKWEPSSSNQPDNIEESLDQAVEEDTELITLDPASLCPVDEGGISYLGEDPFAGAPASQMVTPLNTLPNRSGQCTFSFFFSTHSHRIKCRTAGTSKDLSRGNFLIRISSSLVFSNHISFTGFRKAMNAMLPWHFVFCTRTIMAQSEWPDHFLKTIVISRSGWFWFQMWLSVEICNIFLALLCPLPLQVEFANRSGYERFFHQWVDVFQKIEIPWVSILITALGDFMLARDRIWYSDHSILPRSDLVTTGYVIIKRLNFLGSPSFFPSLSVVL